MTCQACTDAAERISGRFDAGCQGCTARAASRTPQAAESRTLGRQTAAYRDLLQRLGVTHEQVKAAAAADFQARAAC